MSNSRISSYRLSSLYLSCELGPVAWTVSIISLRIIYSATPLTGRFTAPRLKLARWGNLDCTPLTQLYLNTSQ
ncbi:uncharacterized protein K441DRAFT_664651 [Cenococcum geophilum 1.58]|uniref:uncharacterized protein n=1 Tax=Cenococcum geophilum 1.58 TaxID=794803 RepID=UPI00358DE09F|nr:hypothetical protein K441DRAFT_664651 [Cenococcum geophilum 1.58]